MKISKALKLPIIILLLGTIYAIVRYNVFADVSLEHLPLYVLNKGISLGGLVFLVMSRFHKDPQIRRYRGLAGFFLTALHVFISMQILHPGYFAKLFLRSGSMNWRGELSILAGILGFAMLCILYHAAANRSSRPMPRFILKLALLMVTLHAGVIGYNHWLQPHRWPGHLPPITLISCLIALGGVFWSRRRAVEQVNADNVRVIPIRSKSRTLVLLIFLLGHLSPSFLLADEETPAPHCHILVPGAKMYEDVFVDEKGSALDTKEKCKAFRQAKGSEWKGFFKAHAKHCSLGRKDAKSIADRYLCVASGGEWGDRMHVVRE